MAESHYKDFDECSNSEGAILETLTKLRANGQDIRKLLKSKSQAALSIDDEYFLYLFETRPPEKIAMAIIGQCALRFPESSPFSKEDIEKLREAKEQAIRKLILQNHGRIPSEKLSPERVK